MSSGKTPPSDTSLKLIHVNYPKLNFGDSLDALKISYVKIEIYYKNNKDLLFSLDSISESMYYDIEYAIDLRMLYNRYTDIDGDEFLDIKRIRIKGFKYTVVKIRIKKNKELDYDFEPSSLLIFDEKILYYPFLCFY